MGSEMCIRDRSGLGVIVNAALFIVCFRHRTGTELVRDPGCCSEGKIGLVSNTTIITDRSSLHLF